MVASTGKGMAQYVPPGHIDTYGLRAPAYVMYGRSGMSGRAIWHARAIIVPFLDSCDDRGPSPMHHGDSLSHLMATLSASSGLRRHHPLLQTFSTLARSVTSALQYMMRSTLEPTPASPSSDLHNSIAGHVAAYLTCRVYPSTCDYDCTGRAPHNPVSRVPVSSLLYVVICLSVIRRKTYICVPNIPYEAGGGSPDPPKKNSDPRSESPVPTPLGMSADS